ncbi:hypothetical protein BN1195_03588 [Chryseobacterium oranimense G311]|uniref:DUF3127 domain-containing protein n=1 Tax=Chryseobacterium oranimense TaxID=421058 RepID=UPI0005338A60|nr:DUF3127 domain-containing protein [Chryseobacterium oranimense]CEJ71243.1 hypothetical protein BN1195_03588 [Chryseobacterium oranimense G311]DAG72884.1 MAG TPA: protein of unknown function DUF3127 [Caudoviricetes sp.]
MKFKGGIVQVKDLEIFSSGRRKRSIIVYTREKESREFEIHFYDENVDQLEKLEYRDYVVISFNLDSEVFEDESGKSYFTHMIGDKILFHKKYY